MMISVPVQDSEAARLGSLESYAVLNTEPEKDFDDLVRMAKQVFDAQIALISLVGRDEQFFKARAGTDICRTMPRKGSFCEHVVVGHDVMVVLDAALDDRFRSSPFVTDEPHIRFYAGAPLVTPDGIGLGSFCIIDRDPRSAFSDAQIRTLRGFASLAMARLEERKSTRMSMDVRRRFESIAAVSMDAIICTDGADRVLFWNRAAELIFGYSAAEMLGGPLSVIVPPAMQAMHHAGMARVVAGERTKLVGSMVTVPARRRDGSEFPIELSLSHWMEGDEHRFGAIARDVTDRRRAEERLKYEADVDHLTGIANRKVLSEAMTAAADRNASATLLLLDLDGFKDVNDSLGHAAGDEVLKTISTRLKEEVGQEGLVCRVGGDEFAVFLGGRADPMVATSMGERIIQAIEKPIEIDERSVYVGAGGGIATVTGGQWQGDELLSDADLALYSAKADSSNRIRCFTPELRSVARSRTSVSSGLRQAWDRGEFELYYQPQVRLDTGRVIGAEALIRWNHPARGLVSPAAFVPILKSSLLAIPVSEWILKAACRQASTWREYLPDFRMGVNLMSAQFRSGDLPRVVDQALGECGLAADGLELEVTEHIMLRGDIRIKGTLTELRAMGVAIAFDDFGTGYASLTMLKDYPVTRLKIDQSFVRNVDHDQKNLSIVKAITHLAHDLGLNVIAEGIETCEQADLMRQHCAEGQGYFYGRPMTASRFSDLLSASAVRVHRPRSRARG